MDTMLLPQTMINRRCQNQCMHQGNPFALSEMLCQENLKLIVFDQLNLSWIVCTAAFPVSLKAFQSFLNSSSLEFLTQWPFDLITAI